MEQFNYLSVLISVILGLGLTHIVSNFTNIIKADGAEKSKYDAHYYLWIAAFFMLYTIYWWAYWDYSSGVKWTIFEFFVLLIGPLGLYVATDILTFESTDKAKDAIEHFQKNKKLFFGILIVMQVWGILHRPIIRDGFHLDSFLTLNKFCQYFIILLFSIGFFTKKKVINYIVVIGFIADICFAMSLRYWMATNQLSQPLIHW